jgi:tetraacyldisaccharide 4'-kinase
VPTSSLLFLLYPLELVYKLAFAFVTWYRRKRVFTGQFSFKIISVGNLSVGGTGKSVVVPFLVRLLGMQQSAIVLRGYKGTLERRGQPTLVRDANTIFIDVEASGDEAMMYAQSLTVPIVVCKNRVRACSLLERIQPIPEFVLLDDAYQNYAVKKDFEILLVDARRPFENGHCLPIGLLREKDYRRADCIIATHADAVLPAQRDTIKYQLFKDTSPEHIFMGRHACGGVYQCNERMCTLESYRGSKAFVVASVGSFDGVIASVKQAGFVIGKTQQYRDHHAYSAKDITTLLDGMQQYSCNCIVTTAKDWVKLEPLLRQYEEWHLLPIFVIRVDFEFLSTHEYDNFVALLRHKLRTP